MHILRKANTTLQCQVILYILLVVILQYQIDGESFASVLEKQQQDITLQEVPPLHLEQ